MTKVELPKELVEQELDAMKNDFEHQLSHQQTTLDDYLKRAEITEEKLRDQWKETAEKRVFGGLALNELKKREGIEASDEDVSKEIDRLQNLYPAEKENIEKKYDSPTERSRLKTLLAGQKAIDRLWQMATRGDNLKNIV